jgi:SNF2 family DNA or RNA helicase
MEIENWYYLFYDKFNKDHNYGNRETINITLDNLFALDYEQLSNREAIDEFNKFEKTFYIPVDLNLDFYQVIMFKKDQIKYTIIGINIDQLERHITNKLPIPNNDLLIQLCKYHIAYTKAHKHEGMLTADIKNTINKRSQNVIKKVLETTGDVTDQIIENPDFLNCVLYNYQKRTIHWMLEREKNHKIYFDINEIISIRNFYFDFSKLQFINNDMKNVIEFNGGALIDEVGLGKTIQSATLALLNPCNDHSYIKQDVDDTLFSKATLILCPSHLCGQWKRELEKMIKSDYELNIISILTKIHFEKYTYLDLLNADFVIVASNFLENQAFTSKWLTEINSSKTYVKNSDFLTGKAKQIIKRIGKELITSPYNLMNTGVILPVIHWHRIIVDEFHEIYTLPKYKCVQNLLPLFESTYKWCLTGTPFDKGSDNLINMLNYVSNYINKYDSRIMISDNIYTYMSSLFFRRNTKKSIISEYELPPLKEKIIWLKFSQSERMIYNAYLVNENVDKFGVLLRQICCHPKIAEEMKKTLSNCKTLDEMRDSMITHYLNAVNKSLKALELLKLRHTYILLDYKIFRYKREARLLKALDYDPEIPKLDEMNTELAFLKQKYIHQEDNDEDENDIIDEGLYDLPVPKKKNLVKITITDENQEEILKTIGARLWSHNSNPLHIYNSRIARIEERIAEAQKDYTGKKTTYEFYTNVIDIIKTTIDKKNKKILKKSAEDYDSDENSDDDDDDDAEKCGICLGNIGEEEIGVTKCGHLFCWECISTIIKSKSSCPSCKKECTKNDIFTISYEKPKLPSEITKEIKDKQNLINQVGTKLANLIYYLKANDKHTIIFSQWNDLLLQVGDVLDRYGISNVFCRGNIWQRDKAIRTFNSDDKVKVIMLSSDSAASGTNLTKASQIILLDPVYGTYEFRKNTEGQAIGRAYRMGQTKEVEVVRLVIKNTVEEEIYNLNKDQDAKIIDKKPVITEIADNDIDLSDDKIEEINSAKPTRIRKTTKKTIANA